MWNPSECGTVNVELISVESLNVEPSVWNPQYEVWNPQRGCGFPEMQKLLDEC